MVTRLQPRGFALLTVARIDRLGLAGHWPDVVLLECDTINEPVLEHCGRLRAACGAPIVAITRHADAEAWRPGREAGIDEFLVEPFSLDELVARLRIAGHPAPAVATGNSSAHIAYGPLRISQESRRVTVRGTEVELRPTEYELLVTLARRAGQVLSRDHLVNCLSRNGAKDPERALEVHIHELRSKLDVPGLIATVRNVGYRLISQESYRRLEED